MDTVAMLDLNRGHEAETSPLDQRSLDALLGRAFHVGLWDTGRGGFVVALDQNAGYDNANFGWFKARYDRFVYVDRIIVAASARGRGVGRGLYRQLFDVARDAGQGIVGCEVNLVPPNLGSLAFHAALGFEPVGERRLAPGKTVRYLALTL